VPVGGLNAHALPTPLRLSLNALLTALAALSTQPPPYHLHEVHTDTPCCTTHSNTHTDTRLPPPPPVPFFHNVVQAS
jgi:hypothetical protein